MGAGGSVNRRVIAAWASGVRRPASGVLNPPTPFPLSPPPHARRVDAADRYSRQVRYPPIGAAGQARLCSSRVLVLGCGALGSAVAEQLCRAGVGRLRLVDRDLVEPSNLQRQSLYDESDAERGLPKVVAAANRLRLINRSLPIESWISEIDADSVLGLVRDCDLVLDGTDNFPTRHLLNDACCRARIPWIYAACVGAYAISAPILPGETACLRCLQDQLPGPGDNPTCDTTGVIAPAVQVASGWQVAEALKLLTGDRAAVRRELWATDLWTNSFQRLRLDSARDPACASCGPDATYPSLNGERPPAVVLCGRDAIQLRRSAAVADLTALAARLGPALRGANEYLVRWQDGTLDGTCFRDGRVLVHGTSDPLKARAFCDRWLG